MAGMYQARVRFDTVVEAKAFVSICNDMDFKVELIAQPYAVSYTHLIVADSKRREDFPKC